MPNVEIRNVPQDVLAALEQQAASHDRSLEEELLAILEQAVLNRRSSHEDGIRAIFKWQDYWRKQGRVFDDSTELIREDRER